MVFVVYASVDVVHGICSFCECGCCIWYVLSMSVWTWYMVCVVYVSVDVVHGMCSLCQCGMVHVVYVSVDMVRGMFSLCQCGRGTWYV